VKSKTSLMNVIKSEKSAYFRKVFAYNFFRYILLNFFNEFEISVNFCLFWFPYWIFEENCFFCS
jgi:hypothetical protein